MHDRDAVALVGARGLSAGYGRSVALEGLEFDLRSGERMAVLGPNGGGKSTLFRLLLGELEPFGGELVTNAAAAFVPQTERSRLDYPVSALDVALMGTLSRVPWWRPNGRRERRFARDALGRVGLAELADAQFGELSGGQRQRVLVARALVQDAPTLFLDEPFVGVDRPSEELLEQLFVDLADEGRGIMVATHDIEQTYRYDRVLCLNRRQVALGPPLQTLTRGVLETTYGGAIVTLPGEGQPAAILPPHHH
jgi:ABC-type Mn2+/Zn2+ transport system ATPase subunit